MLYPLSYGGNTENPNPAIPLSGTGAWTTVVFATIPDVPWQPLPAVALVTNGLLPVFFYPFSKTIWMALNLHFHPLEANEG